MPRYVWVVCCLLAAAGCATQAGSGVQSVNEHRARRAIELLRPAVEAGDNTIVVPRLQDIIVRYPGTDGANDARYFLGLVYYRIGGYRDAIDVFDEYLRLAPSGKYAGESRGYIAKLGQEYREKYGSVEELDREMSVLKERLTAEPGNLSYEWELADVLWRRGNYAEAADLYMSVTAKKPAYALEPVFQSRFERLPNGQYVALTPSEQTRRQNERQPLAVINESTFHSGRELIARTSQFYSVTGQVVNRSDSVLYGVEVIVTLYGFGNTVYDTTMFSIGRLAPKEIRAFSVRFSNFDNIENVFKHECVPTFQR